MTTAHVLWLLTKHRTKEHVNFPAFAERFRLGDQESATNAYLSLISSSLIRHNRQEKLLKAFAFFQANNEKEFWTDRLLQLNSQITSKNAGVLVQNLGLQLAEAAYNHCSSEIDVGAVPFKSASVPEHKLSDTERSVEMKLEKRVNRTPKMTQNDTVSEPGQTSSDTPRSPKKRKDPLCTKSKPWHSLTVNLMEVVNGMKNVTFPAQEPNMPSLHARLFDHAVESLKEYQPVMMTRNRHKGESPQKKTCSMLEIKGFRFVTPCQRSSVSIAPNCLWRRNVHGDFALLILFTSVKHHSL